MIARWPGKIPPGTVRREPAATIDIFPTLAALTAAPAPPPDHPIDGKDLSPLLFGLPGAKPPHEALFFYYEQDQLQAMRSGRWKLLFPHTSRTIHGQPPGKDGTPTKYLALPVGLELYDLESDVGETKKPRRRPPRRRQPPPVPRRIHARPARRFADETYRHRPSGRRGWRGTDMPKSTSLQIVFRKASGDRPIFPLTLPSAISLSSSSPTPSGSPPSGLPRPGLPPSSGVQWPG